MLRVNRRINCPSVNYNSFLGWYVFLFTTKVPGLRLPSWVSALSVGLSIKNSEIVESARRRQSTTSNNFLFTAQCLTESDCERRVQDQFGVEVTTSADAGGGGEGDAASIAADLTVLEVQLTSLHNVVINSFFLDWKASL